MKRLPTIGCAVLALLAPVATSGVEIVGEAGSEFSAFDQGPWVFRAYDWTPESLREIASYFDHVGFDRDGGFVRIHVDDPEERDRLLGVGLRIEVDAELTRLVRWVQAQFDAGAESLSQIPGFECYRTVEETLATGAALAAQNPTLATWIDLGDSWEKLFPGHGGPGYDLRVLRLTNSGVPGPKPDLLALGAIHAREYTTAELVTRFAEELVAGYGNDPDTTWLLDHHEIHLVVQTNPDGRKRAETGLSWRKNADNDFCVDTNDRGVDLNRNFDFQWDCCGGSSSDPCSFSFHGPSARSEPESIVVMDYMDAIFPDQRPDDLTTPAPDDSEGLFLDFHAFGEIMLSSWGFTTTDPPNGPEILTLARKYTFFPGYEAILGSLGTVDGATKDYAYGRLGVPGYTVELGTDFFQECEDFETTILPGNLAALHHIAKNVRAPYVTPSGPDTVDPTLSASTVEPGEPVTLTATVDDTRYNTPSEPTQPIAAAEAYFDVPPWNGGTPIAMIASDGTFDSTVEAVEVELDTTALEPGRHLLFARGQDSSGTFGAVSAQFLDIVSRPIFADGFESGDTSAWSVTVP